MKYSKVTPKREKLLFLCLLCSICSFSVNQCTDFVIFGQSQPTVAVSIISVQTSDQFSSLVTDFAFLLLLL